MWSYFRGWKRKIGAVTLVAACTFMIGWVRNLVVFDYIEIPIGSHSTVFIVTYSQFFALFAETDPEFNPSTSSAKWGSQLISKLTADDFAALNYDYLQMTIKYRNHPPVIPKGPNQPYGVPKLSDDYRLVGLPLSYSLAIPLTLISAWCLLTKPRMKSATKTESLHA
jgi:hypothetical protein